LPLSAYYAAQGKTGNDREDNGGVGEMARCRDGTRGVEVRERLVVPHPRTGEVADTNEGQ
jgi:hypothetical protein